MNKQRIRVEAFGAINRPCYSAVALAVGAKR
jgi:hypothetical protein